MILQSANDTLVVYNAVITDIARIQYLGTELGRYVRGHHVPSEYYCDFCEKQHSPNDYICDYCARVFESLRHLSVDNNTQVKGLLSLRALRYADTNNKEYYLVRSDNNRVYFLQAYSSYYKFCVTSYNYMHYDSMADVLRDEILSWHKAFYATTRHRLRQYDITDKWTIIWQFTHIYALLRQVVCGDICNAIMVYYVN